MADPTTELAREFLEFNNYAVRKETKFFKNRQNVGTASDIDIIAVSPKDSVVDGIKLSRNIVAEVKNWEVWDKDAVDRIYRGKFKHVNDPKISGKQLRRYFNGRRFDRIIFCLGTTKNTSEYAWKEYGIKIITTGFIIKQMANFFKKSKRNWSYYPEWYNYNLVKSIMHYLSYSHSFKDKLILEDLVWIDPKKDTRFRNKFVKNNAQFFEEFVYNETDAIVLKKLIDRLGHEYPVWFKRTLKSNKKFWAYLTQ